MNNQNQSEQQSSLSNQVKQMSEEYQRFKQNFFKQHPPNSPQSKTTQQTGSKSFKQYDPYSEYTSDRNNTYRGNEDQLRIQNQTHFPFQQIEQTTFQELDNEPFLSYRQQEGSGLDKSGASKNYPSASNHSHNRKEFYEPQYRAMNLDNHGKEIPIRTESQLEYRRVSRHELTPENYSRTEHSGINQINQQLDRVRQTRQQHITQPSHQVNEFQQQRNIGQNNFSQFGYETNNQYIVDNARSNHLHPVSPPKQLPVIYNRPNSHTNSQHKLNPQTANSTNSRLIIQQAPPNLQKPTLLLSPPPNPMHPLIISQPQTFNQVPQIPQPINSGSRVIIQSEIANQSKGSIQSSHSIPPPGYNIVHQPIVMNPPPQVHFEGRNVQEGMISLKEYERLKSECSMWQQKFYQANDQINRFQSERGLHGVSQQTVIMREENTRLMEKIRILQNSDKNAYEKIKSSYEELMKKYQSSLMKEADLLIDRFRLEMKHNERY